MQQESRLHQIQLQNLQLQATLLRRQGRHREADEIMLDLSDEEQMSRKKKIKWKFERECMVFVARTPACGAANAPELPSQLDAVASGDGAVGPRRSSTETSSAVRSNGSTDGAVAECAAEQRGNALDGAAAQPHDRTSSSAASSSPQDNGQSSAEMVGCCIVVLKVLGAILPPPFPSRQPARFYVGSLAVQSHWRRRGAGSAMLCAVETLGALHPVLVIACGVLRVRKLVLTELTQGCIPRGEASRTPVSGCTWCT